MKHHLYTIKKLSHWPLHYVFSASGTVLNTFFHDLNPSEDCIHTICTCYTYSYICIVSFFQFLAIQNRFWSDHKWSHVHDKWQNGAKSKFCCLNKPQGNSLLQSSFKGKNYRSAGWVIISRCPTAFEIDFVFGWISHLNGYRY